MMKVKDRCNLKLMNTVETVHQYSAAHALLSSSHSQGQRARSAEFWWQSEWGTQRTGIPARIL